MRKSSPPHKGLSRVFAVGVIAAMTALTIGVAPASADTGDFYTPPTPLPAGQNGDVIKSLPSTYSSQSGTTSTRVMYLSRDAHDQPMAVTGTVLVPNTPWNGPGARPIVAYAPFTAGMGDQCAVSKAFAGDSGVDLVGSVQSTFVNGLLSKGFAVAQTDYQGLGTPGEHTYVMRLPEAHAVLDVIRAAQRLPGSGLSADGPVGVEGYSEGGAGSAAAVELAPGYAPELNLVGGYAGAVPADLGTLASTLDGSMYAAFLGYALIGINTAYPEAHLMDLANANGADLFVQASKSCTLDAVFKFAFKQTRDLTKEGKPVAAYLDQEPFRTIVAQNQIGKLRPAAPVLIESAPMDDVIPNAIVKQLGKNWCDQGATVQYNDLISFTGFFSHALSAFQASGDAANWLADRFAGKQATSSCGHI